VKKTKYAGREATRQSTGEKSWDRRNTMTALPKKESRRGTIQGRAKKNQMGVRP